MDKRLTYIMIGSLCCIIIFLGGILSLLSDEPMTKVDAAFEKIPLDTNIGKLQEVDEHIYAESEVKEPAPKPTVSKPPSVKVISQSFQDNKASLSAMSGDFDLRAKFPSYSQPLRPNQISVIKPNRFHAVKIRIGDNFKADVKLSSYRLFQGEPIDPVVTILANDVPIPGVVMDVSVQNDKNQELLKIPVSLTENTPNRRQVYSGSIIPSKEQTKDWPEELHISVKVTIEGENTIRLFPSFLYAKPVATLSQSETSPYIEGAHLVIPIQIKTESQGRHVLRGVLFSQEGKPLIHLTGQIDIGEGGTEGTISLKAHASALKAQKSQGPYIFKPTRLERLRRFSGDRLKQGSHKLKEPIQIPSFDFSKYQNESYEDPAMKNKAKFFKKLSTQQGGK